MMRVFLSAVLSVVAIFVLGCGTKREPVASDTFSGAHQTKGASIVHGLAACGFCHGESSQPGSTLSGGRTVVDIYGEVTAPNLTSIPEGLGSWRARDLERVMRGGSIGDESRTWSAHRGYEWMSDEDLISVIAYIKTLRPAGEYIPPRSLGFIERQTSGWSESVREVKGAVPEVSNRDKEARGQYLVDHVARCGYCHSTPASLFSSEKYLEGGRKIWVDGEERIAPDITARAVSGIGGWSVEQIVKYLATGVTPGNEVRGGVFCPTNFYKNAAKDDLVAVSTYLRTVE